MVRSSERVNCERAVPAHDVPSGLDSGGYHAKPVGALGSTYPKDADAESQAVQLGEKFLECSSVLAMAQPPRQDDWLPVGERMPAEVAHILADGGRVRAPAVSRIVDVVDDACGRLQHILDECLGTACFRDIHDAVDDLIAGTTEPGAYMREQAFEAIAQKGFSLLPDLQTPPCRGGVNGAEQERLQDVVARQVLAGRVEHSEHSIGPIDAVRRDEHHATPAKQEIRQPPPLDWFESAEHGDDVIANFERARLRRLQALIAGFAYRTTFADIRGEKFVLPFAELEPGSRFAGCSLDCGQNLRICRLVRLGVEIAQRAHQDGERRQALKTVDDLEVALGRT